MAQNILTHSDLVDEYAQLIKQNQKKRKERGQWYENEPPMVIRDLDYAEEFPDFPDKPLLSLFCVEDIFGDDWQTVQRLLINTRGDFTLMQNFEGWEQVCYYSEDSVKRAIDTLKILAKSNFVNALRPLPQQKVQNEPPVYSNKDLMTILDVKSELLKKFREKGYLGYTKYAGSDKFWYTAKDVENFLNNPKARHEAWKK